MQRFLTVSLCALSFAGAAVAGGSKSQDKKVDNGAPGMAEQPNALINKNQRKMLDEQVDKTNFDGTPKETQPQKKKKK